MASARTPDIADTLFLSLKTVAPIAARTCRNLGDPALTLALLELDAVVGVKATLSDYWDGGPHAKQRRATAHLGHPLEGRSWRRQSCYARLGFDGARLAPAEELVPLEV